MKKCDIPNREEIRRNLTQTVIARPLLDDIEKYRARARGRRKQSAPEFALIIDPNLEYQGGREEACLKIARLIRRVRADARIRHDPAHPYVFVALSVDEILRLIDLDSEGDGSELAQCSGKQRIELPRRAIYRIWADQEIGSLITDSISTVKADAAQVAFKADGHDIVWAVIDSGINEDHPHFRHWNNLDLTPPLAHQDFTGSGIPLTDGLGHGTHVAGIIAGIMTAGDKPRASICTCDARTGDLSNQVREVKRDVSGMAPRCHLLSLKVLDERGKGRTSAVIEALAAIQKLNDFGRRILVHGVNLSVGYAFKPEWFACGQSPLCIEVDRLVRSGVIVVVAAGNSGYGEIAATGGPISSAGLPLTINDPGNAALAITVGSTHRDMPHTYGISYFSSKGPTGDGRLKPDLVAPGERILSCSTGGDFEYKEDSGTSMAAPHASGAIAAFLSIRREFIGQPERVKKLFMDSAIDLGRDRNFQGSGLVDLMRALQSV